MNQYTKFYGTKNCRTPFWCSQCKKMPILAHIAATIFVMQASSAESERHYSAFNARHIITPIRNRLLCPDVVEAVSINLESYKNSLLWINFSEFWLFSSNLLGPGSGFIWFTWVQGQQKWPSFISGPEFWAVISSLQFSEAEPESHQCLSTWSIPSPFLSPTWTIGNQNHREPRRTRIFCGPELDYPLTTKFLRY